MCIENKDSLCTSEQRVYKNENSVYTPGPWKAGRSDMATIVDGVTSKWIYAGDQYVAVASGRIDGDWDQVIANSQLIAAAPDLLEALQRMEVAFTPLAKDSTLANLIDEARAAIAKTTGVAKENFKSEAGFENKPADSFKARAQEQEPVAWTNYNGAVNNRLKGAPVDAKAIRAEALEEAAKFAYDLRFRCCWTAEAIAAAIRGMK